MSLDEALKSLYENSIHFPIIHRRGYDDEESKSQPDHWHLEIGFCTMDRHRTNKNGDLFLWIKLDEKYIPYFIEQYKLVTL